MGRFAQAPQRVQKKKKKRKARGKPQPPPLQPDGSEKAPQLNSSDHQTPAPGGEDEVYSSIFNRTQGDGAKPAQGSSLLSPPPHTNRLQACFDRSGNTDDEDGEPDPAPKSDSLLVKVRSDLSTSLKRASYDCCLSDHCVTLGRAARD